MENNAKQFILIPNEEVLIQIDAEEDAGHILPFGVAGTIVSFIEEETDKKKIILKYIVELQRPSIEIMDFIGDIFAKELSEIGLFCMNNAIPAQDQKLYMKVSPEHCFPIF